jgi:hypothetical protein
MDRHNHIPRKRPARNAAKKPLTQKTPAAQQGRRHRNKEKATAGAKEPGADPRPDRRKKTPVVRQTTPQVVVPQQQRTEVEQLMHSRLYDLRKHPETALRGNKRLLLRGLKGQDLADAKRYLLDQPAYALTRPAPKGKGVYRRRRTMAGSIDDIWQADLADMNNLKEANRGYRFILTIVDVVSRYAFARPLKTKQGAEVSKAFESVFQESGRQPHKIQTDQGKEFYNQQVKSLFDRRKIQHYSTADVETKAAMAERFNRTLKELLTRQIIVQENEQWLDDLPSVMAAYNRAEHSSLGTSPLSFFNMKPEDREKLIDKRLYPHVCNNERQRKQNLRDDREFKAGDWVRIHVLKGTFAKGYMPKWSREEFQIKQKCFSAGRVYFKLVDRQGEDIEGSWLSDQLQHATQQGLKKLVDRVVKKDNRNRRDLVSYFGLPAKFDEWVPRMSNADRVNSQQ